MTTTARKIGPLSIFSLTRKNNSVNGNPSYVLHTSQGDFKTQTDAAFCYGITNYTNSRHRDTYVIGTDADVPEVTLICTASGRVWGIELDGEMLH